MDYKMVFTMFLFLFLSSASVSTYANMVDMKINLIRRSKPHAVHLFPARRHSTIISQVTIRDIEYHMSLTLGSPPVQLSAVLDTGSNLIWTQCKHKQHDQIFDPLSSSTYRSLSCDNEVCSKENRIHNWCDKKQMCKYFYPYGDGSFHTTGTLASETFTFNTTNGRTISVPNITFGCTEYPSEGYYMSGIVGLAHGPLSLVSQLRLTKFSYCLVLHTDYNSSSTLYLGEAGFVRGKGVVSTPLVSSHIDNNHYHLFLERIVVRHHKIPVFEDGGCHYDNGADIIIDTGSVPIILPNNTYQKLKNALLDIINLPTAKYHGWEPWDLCFRNEILPNTSQLVPDIEFVFKEGAKVKLPSSSPFIATGYGMACLAMIAKSKSFNVSIFGHVGQQNIHVGHDIQHRRIYFASRDCSKL